MTALPTYDILVANGRVLDGSSNPWVRADVGAAEGEIVAVTELTSATTDLMLNAEGLDMAPASSMSIPTPPTGSRTSR